MGRIAFTTCSIRIQLLFSGLMLLVGSNLFAQVKIGENPQAINAGSLLELESDELVLVLTRVTTTQMNTLRPLAGALVYNTDIGCVHSFNGTAWVNLCTSSSTGGVSTAPGNSITDNGGAYYDATALQNQLEGTANSIDNHLAADADTNAQNELTDLQLNGTVLALTNPATLGNEVDLAPILGGGSGSNNSAFEVTGGNLTLTDAGGTLSVPITEIEDPNNELITNGAVVGTDLIINEGVTNQVTIDVSALAGGGGSTNLGNTNLTQTGGNRTYTLNNQNLVFSGAGNVGVGATAPQEKLHVGGNLRVDGQLLDSDGDAGTAGQVLSATATGTNWTSQVAAANPFHALGKVSESTALNSTNILTISDMGIGNYRVFFTTAANSSNYVVHLNLLNTGPATIEVTTQTVSGFTVRLYDLAGSPIDGDWFFSVTDF